MVTTRPTSTDTSDPGYWIEIRYIPEIMSGLPGTKRDFIEYWKRIIKVSNLYKERLLMFVITILELQFIIGRYKLY